MKYSRNSITKSVVSIIVATVITIHASENICTNNEDILQPSSTHPQMPGINHMKKVYNMLSGEEISEKYAQDIINYQWCSEPRTVQYGQWQYEIPYEFASTVTPIPTCHTTNEVTAHYYSSSTSVLNEQSKARTSGGGSPSIMGHKVFSGFLIDELEALTFGKTDASREARHRAENQYTWSMSKQSKASLYKAKIGWEQDIGFQFNSRFISAIENLNLNPTYIAILQFFEEWGSHVLSEIELGAHCTQTAYIESTATEQDFESFESHARSESTSYLFWSEQSESTTTEQESETTLEEHNYELSDNYCRGQIDITCGDISHENNAPEVTEYKLWPVWEIKEIKDLYLDDKTIDMIGSLFEQLSTAFRKCSIEKCNDHGTCLLKDDYIVNWDGKNFDDLMDYDPYTYCFCREGYFGDDCLSEQNCGTCTRAENCCCNNNNKCNPGLICDPTINRCVANDADTECFSYGEFKTCNHNNEINKGVMIGACGSGRDPDCSDFSDKCEGGRKWNGMTCAYPDLGSHNVLDTGEWRCGDHGVRVICPGPARGNIMTGLCGSGEKSDCKSQCDGSQHFGIQCSSFKYNSFKYPKIKIDEESCKWESQHDWGEFLECGEARVMTGYCGSGKNRDCNGNVFEIRCCKLLHE